MPIKATRALLKGALDGTLAQAEMRVDERFGFEVPLAAEGVEASLLTPRETWADKAAYDAASVELAAKFVENFTKFEAYVSDDVKASAPKV